MATPHQAIRKRVDGTTIDSLLKALRMSSDPPIIRPAEPGEDRSWCYLDNALFLVEMQ